MINLIWMTILVLSVSFPIVAKTPLNVGESLTYTNALYDYTLTLSEAQYIPQPEGTVLAVHFVLANRHQFAVSGSKYNFDIRSTINTQRVDCIPPFYVTVEQGDTKDGWLCYLMKKPEAVFLTYHHSTFDGNTGTWLVTPSK